MYCTNNKYLEKAVGQWKILLVYIILRWNANYATPRMALVALDRLKCNRQTNIS